MPKPTRTRRILLALGALAAVLALTAATTPQPLYQATGWKAATKNSVYSLSPDPYQIVFADTAARTQLTPYLKPPAYQVTIQVGVPVTVTTTIDTTPTGTCPARHQIVIHYVYRPTDTAGMSIAYPCYTIADGSAWGGHVLIDSEYWTTPGWFSTTDLVNETMRRDVVTHELGHILGLDHPNTDINGDGVVSDGECVRWRRGHKPIMCSPNRGFWDPADGGRFTDEFDLPGLRQMLANYSLRQN